VAAPDLDVERLLDVLTDNAVDFVVIGGIAAVLHGSARATFDLDVCCAPAPENLERLGQALAVLGARLRGVPDDVPFAPDAATLRQIDVLTLSTSAGDLDVLRSPAGAPRYDVLARRADRVEIDGTEILVASVEDLMAMKEASDRPKDRADLAELEAILRLRQSDGP
jgi:predicted nucleotidyltransferase